MSLILSGQPAEAIPHLQEALRLDPMESRMPYLNVLGIAYYGAEDYSSALGIMEDNYERGGPKGPHMDVFIAAAMTHLGEEDEARAVIARVLKKYPSFPLRAWLERWVTDQQQLSQTIAMLQPLGLNLE
jgi:tetratricopeptide (TPR) repeat protein